MLIESFHRRYRFTFLFTIAGEGLVMDRSIGRRCLLETVLLVAAALAGAVGAASAALAADGLKVGVGRTVITPHEPIWMSGYAARNRPSEGVVHDLWAKALAFEDAQGGRAVIVTTDIIGLPRELAEDAAARLNAKHRLARSQIVLNSSHTHSGPVVWPNLRSMYFLGPEENARLERYGKKLVDDLVRTVDAALADLAPARVSSAHGTVKFAVNRREPSPQGVRLGVNPEGPVDHDVPVIKVTSPDGALRAVLFGYACHCTTLGGDSYRINGDFAGFAALELEKALPNTTAMFASLCGADQNPHPRGTMEWAERHGKTLAEEVRRVLDGEMRPVGGPIRSAFETTELEFAPHERATFEKDAESSDKYRQARAKAMLAAYDAGKPVRSMAYPVQAVRFGSDLTLVAMAGEVTVEYSLRLKREFPNENLVVMAFCNEVPCYIPSLNVLKGGGYEPVASMVYYGQPGPFAENVEETVIAACRKVLEAVGVEP